MLDTTRSDAVPLVGRAAEQALLTSFLDEVTTRGRALVLRGEPGIGKSRLLSEAARIAHDRGVTVPAADRRAIRGASAVCRPASAASSRA